MAGYCLTSDQMSILRVLEKWKVLSIIDIKNVLNYERCDSNLRKFINRMALKNVIKKTSGPKGYVLYQLTKMGLGCLGAQNTYLIDDTNIRHDWITSTVSRKILAFGEFDQCMYSREVCEIGEGMLVKNIQPDVLFSKLLPNGKNQWTALEIELTRKAASKVTSKLMRYLDEKRFHQVIYAFDQKVDFDAYLKMFHEIFSKLTPQEIEVAKKKFVFFYSKSLDEIGADLANAQAFANDQMTNLKEALI